MCAVEMRDNANYIADYALKTTSEVNNPSSAQDDPPSKVQRLASDMFLDIAEDEEMEEEEEAKVPTIKIDVEEYLLLFQVPFTMAFDMLDWWHTRSAM